MSRTFLQLVQAASDELGITSPSQLIGTTDDGIRQLIALSNREGNEFCEMANKNGGWQELHKEYSFSTVALAATTGNLTQGSAVITNIPSTVGIVANTWTVTGNGITNIAKVISVDSSTQVTIETPATDTLVGTDLSFGQAAYAIPSDMDYFITQSWWDTAFRWQLLGPLGTQEKNVIKYGISPVGPRVRFWILQNKFWLNPTPASSGDVMAYDYYSNGWCLSASGTAQTVWTADTDTYALDEDCFILGLKWRWRRAKGLDYDEEKDTWQRACQRTLARNGANRDLPLNAMNQGLRLLSDANVPDTGFGA